MCNRLKRCPHIHTNFNCVKMHFLHLLLIYQILIQEVIINNVHIVNWCPFLALVLTFRARHDFLY